MKTPTKNTKVYFVPRVNFSAIKCSYPGEYGVCDGSWTVIQDTMAINLCCSVPHPPGRRDVDGVESANKKKRGPFLSCPSSLRGWGRGSLALGCVIALYPHLTARQFLAQRIPRLTRYEPRCLVRESGSLPDSLVTHTGGRGGGSQSRLVASGAGRGCTSGAGRNLK